MVHHIVMWKFKPEIEENKKEELSYGRKSYSPCRKNPRTFDS